MVAGAENGSLTKSSSFGIHALFFEFPAILQTAIGERRNYNTFDHFLPQPCKIPTMSRAQNDTLLEIDQFKAGPADNWREITSKPCATRCRDKLPSSVRSCFTVSRNEDFLKVRSGQIWGWTGTAAGQAAMGHGRILRYLWAHHLHCLRKLFTALLQICILVPLPSRKHTADEYPPRAAQLHDRPSPSRLAYCSHRRLASGRILGCHAACAHQHCPGPARVDTTGAAAAASNDAASNPRSRPCCTSASGKSPGNSLGISTGISNSSRTSSDRDT